MAMLTVKIKLNVFVSTFLFVVQDQLPDFHLPSLGVLTIPWPYDGPKEPIPTYTVECKSFESNNVY